MGKIRELQAGMSGPDVKALQEAIDLAKDNSAVLAEAGKFGPNTDKAVRAFQTDNGLKPDGIVGRKTRSALFNLGVATIGVYGRAQKSIQSQYQLKAPLLDAWRQSQYTPPPSADTSGPLLQPDLSARIRTGLGTSVFSSQRFPGLTLPLFTPSVPNLNLDVPPMPGQPPSSIGGFKYDHIEVQSGGQSTFPLGGLRQDVFFLTMQVVYVRGDKDGKHVEADYGVTIGSPFTGILANGTPWTFNPYIQFTDVDRFGKLGMFHYWQPYGQVGVQIQGPGDAKPTITASLYPFNFGLDIGDYLTVTAGAGVIANIGLTSGSVVGGQGMLGLTLKLGQPEEKK